MSVYKIYSPYNDIEELITDEENHYKTNLHTHSTYSDANDSMKDMIEAFYDQDFDILAMTEHGIVGKEWDKEPTIIPLYRFQYLWHGKRYYLSTAEYKAVLNGTYRTKSDTRTKKRGLQCVPGGIETNMVVKVFNHINGFFTDALEGVWGKENDYEGPVKAIEESGGLSHINHPTDWLQARKYPDCGTKKENVEFFADIMRRYKSCMGIEVLNMYDIPNRCDRILWDSLLRRLIPEGERSVFGFANSDAHETGQIDTAFMDFILPSYSLENLREAMEKGRFFSVARYAKNELGENFKGKGPVPAVTEIRVDDETDTILIKGVNCSKIEWIADGKIIKTKTADSQGEMMSVINLAEFTDKISCYVRCQLMGEGGICLTQAFICDDGNMERFRTEIPEKKVLTKKEKLKKRFYDSLPGVLIDRDKGMPQ